MSIQAAEVIQCRGVFKAFGGVHANQNISLNVYEGGITGLIGPNGSGKTTLFNSIVGYHPIDAGSIRFRGEEISRLCRPYSISSPLTNGSQNPKATTSQKHSKGKDSFIFQKKNNCLTLPTVISATRNLYLYLK